MSSYQEYVLNIKRYERNWEAEFRNITYANALEIEKDSNIKEISVIYNKGNSEENFNKNFEASQSGIGSLQRINVSAYDKNAIKNNAKFVEGRAPEKPYEIALSKKGTLEYKIGDNIDITLNGGKNTYNIVGFVESLPSDVAGFHYEYVTGAIAYYDKNEITDDTIVNVSILTNNIKKIYETVEELANKLELYETEEEKSANISYYEILLNYELVSGENMAEKDYFGVGEVESREHRTEMLKVALIVLSSTRNSFDNCNLYYI